MKFNEASSTTNEILRIVQTAINETDQIKNVRRERWDVVRDQFYGDITGQSTSGEQTDAVSITQIKGDRTCTEVVLTVMAQSPAVLVESLSQELLETRTGALDSQFHASDVLSTLLEVAPLTYITDTGIVHVEDIEEDAYVPQYRLSVVSPNDFVAWPPFYCDTDKLQVALKRIVRTKAEVEYLIETGVYRKGVQASGSISSNLDDSTDYPASAPVEEVTDTDGVELWTGVMRVPGFDGWVDITVSVDGQTIYRLEKYPYRLCPFVRFRMKPPRHGDGFYSSVSKGSDMQGMQNLQSTTFANMIEGLGFQAAPGGITDAPDVSGLKIRPGQWESAQGNSFTPLTGKADAVGSVQAMNLILGLADQSSGLSQQDLGSAQRGVATASEAAFIQQGANKTMNSFVKLFSLGLEALARVIDEMMRFNDSKDWIDIAFEDDDAKEDYLEEAQQAALFRASVSRVESTPASRLRAIDEHAQMLAGMGAPIDPQQYAETRSEILAQMGISGAKEVSGNPVESALNTIVNAGASEGIDPGVLQQLINQAVEDAKQYTAAMQMAGDGTGQMVNDGFGDEGLGSGGEDYFSPMS